MKRADLRLLAALLALGTVVLAAGLGLRDPWPPDEPRFALIAKDMAESGHWLIPRIAGVLYPDKPPLFFWTVAVFYKLTGSLAVAFLLPSLLAGLGVLWLVFDLARRLWGAEVAAWTGGALLATIQFPLQVKSGQIDAMVCFWTTLGLYGLSRHLLLGPDWRWLAIAGAACGAGVITKGVGFLPFLILVPWLYARVRGWPLPAGGGHGRWLLAAALFFATIGLWLLPMLLATTGSGDPELLQYRDNLLLKQTVTRYADAWGHIKPPWYLVTNAVSWLWLPITLLLPWLMPAWGRDLKARDPVTLLLGAWVLLVLVFFSISDGKRSLYIFPALPALILISGRHLPQLLARPGPRRTLYGLALLLAMLLLAAGAHTLMSPQALREWLADPEQARPLSWTVLGMGLVAASLLCLFRIKRAVAGYVATLLTIWLGASLLVYPRKSTTRDRARASSRPRPQPSGPATRSDLPVGKPSYCCNGTGRRCTSATGEMTMGRKAVRRRRGCRKTSITGSCCRKPCSSPVSIQRACGTLASLTGRIGCWPGRRRSCRTVPGKRPRRNTVSFSTRRSEPPQHTERRDEREPRPVVADE